MQGDLLALIMYVIVGSITPGPNNLMLLQAGLTSGIKRCRWHALGISSGGVSMVFLSYWGVTEVLIQFPVFLTVLKSIGSAYLVWLTWGIWSRGIVPSNDKIEQARNNARWTLPFTFWQAVLFQYVNPKAWTNTMLMPALCSITGTNPVFDNWVFYVIFFMISIVCVFIWIIGGNSLRIFLHNKRLMNVISSIIIVSTLYCAASMWF